MILLRTGLNDSIFLSWAICLFDEIVHTCKAPSSWILESASQTEKYGPSAFGVPGSLQWMLGPETTLSWSSSFCLCFSGDVSNRKVKAGGEMFHYLIVLLGWPRESCWVGLDYPDHVFILLDSNCQHVWKKKNLSPCASFFICPRSNTHFG